jgi:hypothetical protein
MYLIIYFLLILSEKKEEDSVCSHELSKTRIFSLARLSPKNRVAYDTTELTASTKTNSPLRCDVKADAKTNPSHLHRNTAIYYIPEEDLA